MAAKGKIELDEERCKGCQLCFDACPSGCLDESDSINRKGYHPARFTQNPVGSKNGCTGCTMCAVCCPETAIEVYRAQ